MIGSPEGNGIGEPIGLDARGSPQMISSPFTCITNFRASSLKFYPRIHIPPPGNAGRFGYTIPLDFVLVAENRGPAGRVICRSLLAARFGFPHQNFQITAGLLEVVECFFGSLEERFGGDFTAYGIFHPQLRNQSPLGKHALDFRGQVFAPDVLLDLEFD